MSMLHSANMNLGQNVQKVITFLFFKNKNGYSKKCSYFLKCNVRIVPNKPGHVNCINVISMMKKIKRLNAI